MPPALQVTQARPGFDGTQAYYNSGWKDPGQSFTVSISSGTRPGTYRFFCLLHREGMTGKLTVVPASTAIPTPSQVAAKGAKQLAAAQALLAAPLQALRQGKPPIPVTLPGKHVVLAGSGNPAAGSGSISEFGPKVIHVPVGGYVIWYLIGPHSITFNSNKTDDDIRATAPDGTVHLNPKALVPAGGPGRARPRKGWLRQGDNLQGRRGVDVEREGLPQLRHLRELRPAADRGLPAHGSPGQAPTSTSAPCTTT